MARTYDFKRLQQAAPTLDQQGVTPRSLHLRVVRGPGAVPEARDEATPSPDELYRRYAPYVGAIAIRILGRDQEIDDVVQDVFIDALRGLSGLREPGAVKGWLARITVRAATRKLRARRLLRAISLDGDPQDYEALADDGASAEQRALIGKLYRVLDTMPVSERVVWTLRHVQGEELLRIGELCGFSLSTVQRRLREAQARIARELGTREERA